MMRKRKAIVAVGVLVLVAINAPVLAVKSPFTNKVMAIDDLSVSVKKLLEKMPGVAKVEVHSPAEGVKSRLVHFRNVHALPQKVWIEEEEQARGRKLTFPEIVALLRARYAAIEEGQKPIVECLKTLSEKHGLTEVGIEGLPKRALANYLKNANELKEMARKEPGWRRDFSRKLKAGNKKEANEIAKKMLAYQIKRGMDGIGARLLLAGIIKNVIPIEDHVALAAGTPKIINGKQVPDKKKNAAREEAVVRIALSERKCVVIIFGGYHDFTGAVKKVAPGCEYIRVTPKDFSEPAEQ
jgi:hypothetical protein